MSRKPRQAMRNGTANLVRIVDILGTASLLTVGIALLTHPAYPLALAAVASVLAYWVVLRITAICCCAGRYWPSPALLYLMLAMVTNHLGAFMLYSSSTGAKAQSAVLMIWVYCLSYLATAAGIWIYTRLSGLDASLLLRRYYSSPVVIPRGQAALLAPMAILWLLSIGPALYVLGGTLPVFTVAAHAVRGDLVGAFALSKAVRELINQPEHYRFQEYFNQFRVAILPMLSVFWFLIWRTCRQKLYGWLAAASITITSLLLISGMERAPVLYFVIELMAASYLIMEARPNIRWIWGLAAAFVALMGLSLMLGRFIPEASLGANIALQSQLVAERLFTGNTEGVMKTFEVFPSETPFRWGATWATDLAGLLPGPGGKSLAVEIFEYFKAGAGSATQSLISEMWANGGAPMVAAFSFLLGLFFQWLNFRLMNPLRRNPLMMVQSAMIIFFFGLWGMGGFVDPVSQGLVTVLFITWLMTRFQIVGESLNVTPDVETGMPPAPPASSGPGQPAAHAEA